MVMFAIVNAAESAAADDAAGAEMGFVDVTVQLLQCDLLIHSPIVSAAVPHGFSRAAPICLCVRIAENRLNIES